ncbi:caffeic acid 3-O-methyltransferase 1 [Cinnamomum micranthum f. kanehirae]|uniref:Caffeic acid 3-O-methyltransferase 1 n=1 Tax=Cinnamomum micranthum f. kanehirae TaxID=337451 RepID=A0A3S3NFD0_9MAGN|nr:caffeic acid 3-O-methyltransferase 1 [Cinnamomum micranthum f. kanehirae]
MLVCHATSKRIHPPMALKVAIELDVLEIIAKVGPGTQILSTQVVSHLPTHNSDAPIYSVQTRSIVKRDNGCVQRIYGLGPVCKFFIENEDGVSLAPLLLSIHDIVNIKPW